MRLLVNAARGTHAGACGRYARRRTTVDCDDSDGVFLRRGLASHQPAFDQAALNAARGTHAGACGRHARRQPTVDCDDSDGVFLLGTWTSASYHLYMMAPLEHMAFLQKQANAAQFTTAASLRKSTKLPVITAAEIAAASLEATAERAVTNDFGLGPDIYSDSDDDTDDFASDAPAPDTAPAVAPTASLPEAPPPEANSLRRHTNLCNELASDPAQPDNSGSFLKLDSLSNRIAAESATPLPGPHRGPAAYRLGV